MELFLGWRHCFEADGTVLRLMALFWGWWNCSAGDGTILRLKALSWGLWNCSETDGTVLFADYYHSCGKDWRLHYRGVEVCIRGQRQIPQVRRLTFPFLLAQWREDRLCCVSVLGKTGKFLWLYIYIYACFFSDTSSHLKNFSPTT